MDDKLNATDGVDASVVRRNGTTEKVSPKGVFLWKCLDKDGNLKWEDSINNTVVTVGANVLLDANFATSNYLAVGPYLGILTATTAPAITTADTMSTHAGWSEAGNAVAPALMSVRPTLLFAVATARSKTATTAAVTASGAGTAKGAFLVYFTGATNTIDSTAGTLFSAGTFTGGDKLLATGDTLLVTYSLSA